MKIAVYTAITSNYDTLKLIYNQYPDIDFICFTDNQKLKYNCGNWNIRSIPNDILNFSTVKQQRLLKILPHKYLSEYDISLWVDGNISIISDVYNFIKGYDLSQNFFFTRKHPTRDCIYQEAKAILSYKKDSPCIIEGIVNRYKKEGLPEHNGMEETCIILRDHNNVKCKILDNMWAKELIENSHRDQMSFNYCLWKLGYKIGHLNLNKDLRKDSNFKWSKHG